jgi:hypothetical protein
MGHLLVVNFGHYPTADKFKFSCSEKFNAESDSDLLENTKENYPAVDCMPVSSHSAS